MKILQDCFSVLILLAFQCYNFVQCPFISNIYDTAAASTIQQ